MHVHRGTLPLTDQICVKSVQMILTTANNWVSRFKTSPDSYLLPQVAAETRPFLRSEGTFYSQAIFETTIWGKNFIGKMMKDAKKCSQ